MLWGEEKQITSSLRIHILKIFRPRVENISNNTFKTSINPAFKVTCQILCSQILQIIYFKVLYISNFQGTF